VEEVNFANVSNPQPTTINNDDDFAGTCVVDGDSHGFWRHGPTCADLGPTFDIFKLNNNGTLLGQLDAPVTWTWDAATSMPSLSLVNVPPTTELRGINDNGAMVGSMAGGPGDVAILFEANGVTDLNSRLRRPTGCLRKPMRSTTLGRSREPDT
jgi:hypothetical protein